MRIHGTPRYLRSNNGPKFVSKALLAWAMKGPLQLALIEPGKLGKMEPMKASTVNFVMNVYQWSGSVIVWRQKL